MSLRTRPYFIHPLVRLGVLALTTVGLVAAVAGPAEADCSPPAYCGPSYVSVVSLSSTSRFLNYGAELYPGAMSADGRYVIFTSWSPAVPEDTNGKRDVYRRDLTAGTVVRVSTNPLGGQSSGDALGSAISANGRYVSFVSNGDDVLLGRPTGAVNSWKVYRKDLETGAVKKVSTTASGSDPSDYNATPGPVSAVNSISADGRFVVFESTVAALVGSPSTNATEIYRKDLSTGGIVRVSQVGAGMANGSSAVPVVSADGRFVAFRSAATNLAAGAVGTSNVYRKDLTTGSVVLVSSNGSGTSANGASGGPVISDDGRYVAFYSVGTNLAAGDTDGAYDVFRKDLTTGAVVLVSADPAGTVGNGASWNPSISSDGHIVVFSTLADNLVAGDTNATIDVYYKNLTTGGVQRVSTRYDGGSINDWSDRPVVSGDGNFVTFLSWADNVVSGDHNDSNDIFRTNLALPV